MGAELPIYVPDRIAEGYGPSAVDVVVGEHRRRTAALQGVDQDLGGPVHVEERRRVGKQRLQRGVQIGLGALRPDAPPRQGPGQGFGQAQAQLVLANRLRIGRPLGPQAARERTRHAQEARHL